MKVWALGMRSVSVVGGNDFFFYRRTSSSCLTTAPWFLIFTSPNANARLDSCPTPFHASDMGPTPDLGKYARPPRAAFSGVRIV